MSITVELDKDEIFKAIKLYVDMNYGNLEATGKISIITDGNGYIKRAEAKCSYKKDELRLTPKKLY